MWALSITISGSVLCTSGVVSLHTTISGHFNKVQGTIETARQVGHVNVKAEFLTKQVEGLVRGVAVHQVDTRTNVGGVGAVGNKLQSQGVARSGDTVCSTVVGTIESATLGASGAVWAHGSVPFVSGVAVVGLLVKSARERLVPTKLYVHRPKHEASASY
jgi:hypothetical protein